MQLSSGIPGAFCYVHVLALFIRYDASYAAVKWNSKGMVCGIPGCYVVVSGSHAAFSCVCGLAIFDLA